MTKKLQVIKNEKGFTLFEVIISIAVSSIILVVLTQLLSMTLVTKAEIEYDNKVFNQGINIAEKIRANVFTLQAHSVSIVEGANITTVTISHDYDIAVNVDNVLERNYDNPILQDLVYNVTSESLTYNSEALHSQYTRILPGSSITIIPLNEALCTSDPTNDICSQGIIKLDLYMVYEINGNPGDIKHYVFTIIV